MRVAAKISNLSVETMSDTILPIVVVCTEGRKTTQEIIDSKFSNLARVFDRNHFVATHIEWHENNANGK